MAQKAQLPLPEKLLPVFSGPARYRGAHGGRGSAKTRSFALMTGVDGYRLGRMGVSGLMLCGREHLNSLDESSMAEVKLAIASVPWLLDYYEIGEKYIRSRDGRIKYAFTGLRHNIGATKSKARILRAWVDEAEHVEELAWRTLIPTVRDEDPGGAWKSEVWLTWNPELENSATNQRFLVKPPDNAKIVQMNWQDNPWFPDTLNEERLNDLKNRPELYDHIWEGAYLVITDAQVFKDKFEIDEFEVGTDWDGPYFGMDFGFATDPTVAVESYIHNRVLYVRREMYKYKLELDDTAQAVATALPRAAMHVIRADSARPESISYLKRSGLPKIIGAKKGPGSVEDGIAYMKQFDKIVIHPDAPNVGREFRLHSYKVDRLSGDILPRFVDSDNHGIDAIRYSLEPMIRVRGRPRLRVL